MPQFQPVNFGKYFLLDRIATGGMAEVFKAKIVGDHGFEKIVIIKTLFPHLQTEQELVDSFIEEAKLAALLQHPNVVQIYDFGKTEDSYFIAMEYLPGINLRHILDVVQPFPMMPETALFIAHQTCAGLHYAHTRTNDEEIPLGIIHRDVSPPNILITDQGQLKIIDFGIAKAASQNTSTQMGIIKGKVAYMSPEQARGEIIDHRSDIFSVGIILYEMVTGRPLYKGDTSDILEKARNADFIPVETANPDLPKPIYAVIRRALEKDVDRRYPFADDMMADIDECMSRLGIRASNHRLAIFLEQIDGRRTPNRTQKAIDDKKMPPDTGEITSEYEDTVVIDTMEHAQPGTRKRPLYLLAVLALAVIAGVFILHAGISGTFLNRTDQQVLPVTAPELEAAQPLEDSVSRAAVASVPEKENAGSTEPVKPETSALEALDKKEYHEAVNHFEVLFKQDPSQRQALKQQYIKALLGEAGRLTHSAEYDNARTLYQKIIVLDEQCVDAFFNLGYIHARNRAFTQAEAMYQKAVDLSPEYLDEALFNLAVVQDRLGKKEAVALNLVRAHSINPKNTRVEKYLEKFNKKHGSQ